jgi:hypothetical protein
MTAQALSSAAHHDDLDREAYNAAFYELGLRFHWDADTYAQLLAAHPSAPARVRAYLETQQAHLLRAYDADFLVAAIEDGRQRLRAQRRTTRPAGRCNWAALQAVQVGA